MDLTTDVRVCCLYQFDDDRASLPMALKLKKIVDVAMECRLFDVKLTFVNLL